MDGITLILIAAAVLCMALAIALTYTPDTAPTDTTPPTVHVPTDTTPPTVHVPTDTTPTATEPDTTPPTVIGATFVGYNRIDVTFSEPVTTAGSWSAEPWLQILSAEEGYSPNTVSLSVSSFPTSGKTYMIRVPAYVTDRAIPPNSVAIYTTVNATYTPLDTASSAAPPTFTAEFTDARTIALLASEPLRISTVTSAAFAVTVPDGDDADALPDAVSVALGAIHWYHIPSMVRLTLAEDAVDGVTYTITPSASVTDLDGTAYAAGSIVATYTPDTTPPTLIATFTNARSITLMAGEIMGRYRDHVRHTITVPDGDDDDALPDAVHETSLGHVPFETTGLSYLFLDLAYDAAIGVEHTISMPTSLNDANGVRYNGANITATYAPAIVPPNDTTPPTFTAAFLNTRSIVLTASEPLDTSTIREMNFVVTIPDGNDADTLPDPVPVMLGHVHSAVRSTLVWLRLSADVTEGIVHTITPSSSVADVNGVTYAAGGVTAAYMKPSATYAPDTTPPTLNSMNFADSTHINVSFSEPVTIDGVWTVEPSLGTVTAARGTFFSTRVVLTMETPAIVGTEYKVSIPAQVTDRADTPNAVTGIKSMILNYTGSDYTRPTFTAAFRDASTIVLTASEALDPDTVTEPRFAVTVPDGEDPDALRDPVEVAWLLGPLAPDLRVIQIGLSTPAAEGVAYKITPSDRVTDSSGNRAPSNIGTLAVYTAP